MFFTKILGKMGQGAGSFVFLKSGIGVAIIAFVRRSTL